MIPIFILFLILVLFIRWSINANPSFENFTPYISAYPQSVPQQFDKAFYFPKKLDWQYYSYSPRYYAPMYTWTAYHHDYGKDTKFNDDGMGKPLVQKLHYGYSHF